MRCNLDADDQFVIQFLETPVLINNDSTAAKALSTAYVAQYVELGGHPESNRPLENIGTMKNIGIYACANPDEKLQLKHLDDLYWSLTLVKKLLVVTEHPLFIPKGALPLLHKLN